MVRVLVSTLIRESVSSGASLEIENSNALLELIETKERLKTAPPAPVEGLCLAGMYYVG